MLEKSGAAFSRWAHLALAVVLLVLGASSLPAQGSTGKIEGTVLDPNGQPVAGAQVVIVGTAGGAVTSSSGYYFINNVPAGVYSLRAQMIGFSPAEVRNARVLADQTLTVNFNLSGAVALGAITVEVQQNPIVPRDQVTSKSIVTGTVINDMPVDNIRAVISLQPGVVESGKGDGLSIRGGRAGEAAVYVDGALVRSQNSGGSRLNVGTNALEEASVTTGALGAEYSEAQSGVISYVTKGGGSRLNGALSYESDEMFGNAISLGYNRAEASIGGPIMGNLTFFLSGTLNGRKSGTRGKGGDVIPTYVLGGLDTTVTETLSDGSTKTVDVPRYIQFSGQCDAADNYGYECQGRRLPYNWTTNATGQGKLQYSYGSGSRVSGTFLYSQDQTRNANTGFNYRIGTGARSWSNGFIVNWTQQVFRSSERELAFDVNLSYQNDYTIAGQLTDEYQNSTANRNPFNGWMLTPMQFRLDFDHFSDDTPDMYNGQDSLVVTSLKSQADWDRLIQNVRTNQGTRLPYWNRSELNTSQPYRLNPWGYATGFSTEGIGNFGENLYQEKRLLGRANVDWQFDRYNRAKFGGDWQNSTINWFNSGVIRQIFGEFYSETPTRYGLYAQDRLDLGDVIIEGGIRYDFFDTGAYIATTPGRIFTNPNFDPQASYDQLFDPANEIMTRVSGHSAWSPRLRVSFPVTDKTGFRMSYAQQVQSPDFNSIYQGINNDLGFTNTNDNFPRDVTWGKSIAFEFGIQHAFSQDFVFDISAYNKDKVSDLAARIEPFYDPATDKIMNVNVLRNADFGNTRGVDMSLISRIGDFFNGQLVYTYQVAKSTGTDPFSYLNTTSRATLAVTGERVDPPQALLPFGENRTHNIAGTMAFSFPNDFSQGSWYGTLLRNGGAFLRFRFASGLPYTKLKNQGNGQRAPFEAWGLSSPSADPVNSSTMPWIKELDLRLTKGLRLGGAQATVYADFRNLLNFTSISALFIETGDVVNSVHRTNAIQPEVERLRNEAGANAVAVGDGTVNILLPANCNDWNGGPVNCVSLKRAESRFGNGDGTFTEAEYMGMWNGQYDINNGKYTFYAAPRHIQLGFELRF